MRVMRIADSIWPQLEATRFIPSAQRYRRRKRTLDSLFCRFGVALSQWWSVYISPTAEIMHSQVLKVSETNPICLLYVGSFLRFWGRNFGSDLWIFTMVELCYKAHQSSDFGRGSYAVEGSDLESGLQSRQSRCSRTWICACLEAVCLSFSQSGRSLDHSRIHQFAENDTDVWIHLALLAECE